MLAPQNQSPWNYLRGSDSISASFHPLTRLTSPSVFAASKLPLSGIADFSTQLAPLDKPSAICSSHALDVLADIYAEQAGKKKEAEKALDLLASKYDPIRAGYWNWRKSRLVETTAEA